MSLLQTLRFITRHPLNRRARLGAAVRYLRWQAVSRLGTGAMVHDWVQGVRFIVRRGETGLTGNIYTGLHEFTDMGFVLHYLRSGDLFVDVGANMGSYTLLACGVAGARGIAIEPGVAAHARLVENLRLNRLEDRVQCIAKCAGPAEGSVAFTLGGDTTNHVGIPGAGNEVCEVPMTSLDTVLGASSPSLVKVDVEGYEAAVLEGAARTLQEPGLRAIIIEMNGGGTRYGFDERGIPGRLGALGFEACDYEPLRRTLLPGPARSRHSDNTLFVRDRGFVEQRLRDAPRFEVLGTVL